MGDDGDDADDDELAAVSESMCCCERHAGCHESGAGSGFVSVSVDAQRLIDAACRLLKMSFERPAVRVNATKVPTRHCSMTNGRQH